MVSSVAPNSSAMHSILSISIRLRELRLLRTRDWTQMPLSSVVRIPRLREVWGISFWPGIYSIRPLGKAIRKRIMCRLSLRVKASFLSRSLFSGIDRRTSTPGSVTLYSLLTSELNFSTAAFMSSFFVFPLKRRWAWALRGMALSLSPPLMLTI